MVIFYLPLIFEKFMHARVLFLIEMHLSRVVMFILCIIFWCMATLILSPYLLQPLQVIKVKRLAKIII